MTTEKQQRIDVVKLADTKKVTVLTRACKRFLVNKAIEERAKNKKTEASNLLKEELKEGKFSCGIYDIDIIEKKGSTTLNKEVLKALYPEVFADARIWKTGEPHLVLDKVTIRIK